MGALVLSAPRPFCLFFRIYYIDEKNIAHLWSCAFL